MIEMPGHESFPRIIRKDGPREPLSQPAWRIGLDKYISVQYGLEREFDKSGFGLILQSSSIGVFRSDPKVSEMM